MSAMASTLRTGRLPIDSGVALAQGPIGMLLDARWQGLLVDGARVYPLHAYRVAFLVCTLFVVISGAAGLLLTETGGENVSREAP